MDKKTQKILEEIENGYDRLADKFSETRKHFWKDLDFIVDLVRSGDRVLDFGCGNGRLLEILGGKDIEYHGVDVSERLIQKAQEKYPEFQDNFQKISSLESLPFPKDYFNVIISVAVFHHFPPEYQGKRMEELCEMLQPGGTIILTVWNLNQKNILSSKKWEALSEDEAYISFRDNEGERFRRYHFVFSKEGLKALAEKAGFRVERCDIVNDRNLVLLARKD